jgi:hypothetical protein
MMSKIKTMRIVIFIITFAIILGVVLSPLVNGKQVLAESNIDKVNAELEFNALLPILQYRSSVYSVDTIFGVESHHLHGDEYVAVDQANTNWVRLNGLLWSKAEQVEGTIVWDEFADLEQEIFNASTIGMNVILVVRSTPTWAQEDTGSFCGPIKVDKVSAFADFMYEAVKRYSAPPFNVKYWQVWNEPDVDHNIVLTNPDNSFAYFGCWGDPADTYYGGGDYADVLQAVYPKVKAANPEAQVLVGGLLLPCKQGVSKGPCDHQEKYLEGILDHHGAKDGGNYFDYVAFHSYDYYWGSLGKYGNSNWGSRWDDSPVITKKTAFLKDVMTQYGYTQKPLLSTETALVCGSDGEEPMCLTGDFEDTKAYYVAHSYSNAIADDLVVNLWYATRSGWRGNDLLGSGSVKLPAFFSFWFARQKLMNGAFSRSLSEYSDITGFEFNLYDHRIWVVWSTAKDAAGNPAATQIILPDIPWSVWDVFGKSIPITGTDFTVTTKPQYIYWPLP